ncbi:uncharacterized protein LOC135814667 isoform X2 [Sycon ciliatum]|uniref:uncharacterized protein LOC135814667 isoform X2 n=1 Tax=Sycon ciliatum TaxID=27933 RepID=UPI0031F703E4
MDIAVGKTVAVVAAMYIIILLLFSASLVKIPYDRARDCPNLRLGRDIRSLNPMRPQQPPEQVLLASAADTIRRSLNCRMSHVRGLQGGVWTTMDAQFLRITTDQTNSYIQWAGGAQSVAAYAGRLAKVFMHCSVTDTTAAGAQPGTAPLQPRPAIIFCLPVKFAGTYEYSSCQNVAVLPARLTGPEPGQPMPPPGPRGMPQAGQPMPPPGPRAMPQAGQPMPPVRAMPQAQAQVMQAPAARAMPPGPLPQQAMPQGGMMPGRQFGAQPPPGFGGVPPPASSWNQQARQNGLFQDPEAEQLEQRRVSFRVIAGVAGGLAVVVALIIIIVAYYRRKQIQKEKEGMSGWDRSQNHPSSRISRAHTPDPYNNVEDNSNAMTEQPIFLQAVPIDTGTDAATVLTNPLTATSMGVHDSSMHDMDPHQHTSTRASNDDLRYEDVSSSSYYDRNMSDDTWMEDDDARGWSKSKRASFTSFSSGMTDSVAQGKPRKALMPSKAARRRRDRHKHNGSRHVHSDMDLAEEDEDEFDHDHHHHDHHHDHHRRHTECSCADCDDIPPDYDDGDCSCHVHAASAAQDDTCSCRPHTCSRHSSEGQQQQQQVCSCGRPAQKQSAASIPGQSPPAQSHSAAAVDVATCTCQQQAAVETRSVPAHHQHHQNLGALSLEGQPLPAMRTLSNPCPTLSRFRSQPDMHTEDYYREMARFYPGNPHFMNPYASALSGPAAAPHSGYHCNCSLCLQNRNQSLDLKQGLLADNQFGHAHGNVHAQSQPTAHAAHAAAYSPTATVQPQQPCTCHFCIQPGVPHQNASSSSQFKPLSSGLGHLPTHPAMPASQQAPMHTQPTHQYPGRLQRHRSDGDLLLAANNTSRFQQHFQYPTTRFHQQPTQINHAAVNHQNLGVQNGNIAQVQPMMQQQHMTMQQQQQQQQQPLQQQHMTMQQTVTAMPRQPQQQLHVHPTQTGSVAVEQQQQPAMTEDMNYCNGCADNTEDDQHASWCPGDYENFQNPLAPSSGVLSEMRTALGRDRRSQAHSESMARQALLEQHQQQQPYEYLDSAAMAAAESQQQQIFDAHIYDDVMMEATSSPNSYPGVTPTHQAHYNPQHAVSGEEYMQHSNYARPPMPVPNAPPLPKILQQARQQNQQRAAHLTGQKPPIAVKPQAKPRSQL